MITNAHFVTFLWRSKGYPEPATSTGPASSWYEEAELWARENDLIYEVYPVAQFEIMGSCSNARAIDMIYRCYNI